MHVYSDSGLQFCQFLFKDDQPLLFHTGHRRPFPQVRDAVARIIDPSSVRWIGHSHFEADECGSLNEWLELAPAREVPVTVELDSGAILDGAIDLLNEQPDGQLVIVDYKTDRVSEADFASRAKSYRPQGAAYAESVRGATGKDVSRVALVFAALGGRASEIDPSSRADGEDLPNLDG